MHRKTLTFILTCIWLLFLASPSIALGTVYQKAVDAYAQEDYTTAHDIFLELAEQGIVKAQYKLGLIYGKGKGVTKNYSKALKWWNLAADKGNAKAQYNLGWMYEMGKGVSIDNQKAVSLYRLASIKGHPKAQERLDLIINKAAEAQINFALGIQFERGQGVPQDLREAIKRYRIAAKLGHIKAQEKINLVLSEQFLKEIKSDKTRTIESTNQSNKEIKPLQNTTKSLHTESDIIKLDKVGTIEPANKANIKGNLDKLASIAAARINMLLNANKFKSTKEKNSTDNESLTIQKPLLKNEPETVEKDNTQEINQPIADIWEANLTEQNSTEIKNLHTIIASLRSELEKIKSDKAREIELINQSNAEAALNKIASIKEFQNLKQKSSNEIKALQHTTTSLRSKLDKIKSDEARAIEATNQINAKSEKKIKALQTTTISLQSELEIIKSEKDREIKIINQANAKEKLEKIASIKEFEKLKQKSSKEIKALQVKTESLRSKLDKTKADEASAIQVANQNNAKPEKKIKTLQATTKILQNELEKIKSDKAKEIKIINQANAKEKLEKVASIKEFKKLKQKSYKEIKALQLKTKSLRSKLDKIKYDEIRAIQVANQTNAKSGKKIKALQTTTKSLLSELEKIKSEKARETEIINLANAKAKLDKIASINKFKKLKQKSSKEIKALQVKTTSLRSKLNKIKSNESRAIQVANQANAKSGKKIKALQTTTKLLLSELDKIKSDIVRETEIINQTNAKAKLEKIASIKNFEQLKQKSSKKINKLQVKTESLRSKLDKKISEEAPSTQVAKQINIKTGDGITSKDFMPEYLNKWAHAWEQQNIDLYLSFYSKEFKGSKQRHAAWRASRKVALKKHTSISIQLKNIEISRSKEIIELNFTQIFKSSKQSDIGTKKLVWVKNGSDWKIIKETWMPHKNLSNMGWQYQ